MGRYYILILSLIILITSESNAQWLNNLKNSGFQQLAADSIPSDLPILTVDILDNPSPYYLFLGSIANTPSGNIYGNYLMVMDSLCNPFVYKKVGMDLAKFPLNFMQAANGNLVHIEKTPKLTTMYVSDTTLNRIDSLPNKITTIIQGYFELLPNGNYLVDHIADIIPMDFSLIFEGGEPNGTLQSSTIYEYDKNKNVVFCWRAPDYIPITETYTDSLVSNVPYVHINNVEQDFDGNYLVSSRHLSSIFKINRMTGDIMWKLGGKHNEFTFIDEHEENAPNYFSFQHDIRRLPNGNISLFDNGTQHNPKYSRAVEYKLDEVNKTATLVWEYRNTPDIYAVAQGSVQKQPNGNVLIFWGDAALSGGIAVTEVKPDNTKALELRFPKGYKSLRVVKYPLAWSEPSADVSKEVLQGNTYEFKKDDENTCVTMKITNLVESFYPTINVEKYDFSPQNPDFEDPIAPMVKDKRIVIGLSSIISYEAEIRFNSQCLGINYQPEKYVVYSRYLAGQDKFSQIPTTFDTETGDYVINTSKLGEFVLAVPQAVSAPLIVSLSTPLNAAKTNKTKATKFTWNPRGYFTHSQLQIALDDQFTNMVLDSILIGLPEASISNLSADNNHFWRVRSIIADSSGEWSEVRSFNPSDPYILVTVPNGGEKWEKDSVVKIIRWEKNIDDLVRIELMKNDDVVLMIKDSLSCPTGAYGWKIPSSVEIDSTYKIRVTSLKDAGLSTISGNVFSIIDDITSIDEVDSEKLFLGISPNPATDNIVLSIPEKAGTDFNISIFNSYGNEIMRFDRQELSLKGSLNISTKSLSSGVYYCTLNLGSNRITTSFVIIK
jgi:hypothetical protein